jgi:pyruvate dehydrogenase E1 component
MTDTLHPIDAGLIPTLETLDARLRWLSAWTIHNANHLRDSRDGLKVGGHQASCASISTVMAALYFHALRPTDRVAVKPHAAPVLHAIHYLLGDQSLDQLQRFRGLGGAQSYPSRTKDKIPVDFSTGSVGLGVAVTAFASLVQDYLISHGELAEADAGRMIALMGDAELDEGNIYEALIEGYKHDIRNCWWIVDYNRQSLDATTADRMFRRFDDIFETCGWRVLTLKYGKRQQAAFKKPGGKSLQEWIDSCPNADFAVLTYQGGAGWRERLTRDIGAKAHVAKLLASYDDEALADLMTNLGGHCVETLVEAFEAASDERPTLFIAYTIKGFGLPFAGHKDNHAGLMNPGQIDQLRRSLNIAQGEEWAPYAGLGDNAAASLKAFVASSPLSRRHASATAPTVPVPDRLAPPEGAEQSTQSAFGKILLELAKSGHPLADRIVTTSPDVTVSTNLGAFVNQRGLFRRQELLDVFRNAKIPSAQKWSGHGAGQHIELGIAENNLFLVLAALGLAGPLFGARLIPIGTVYDPFIARGLDALNYACYQDARFLLVATPSGVTLGPEGGAHQSINSPLIGIGQPGLTYFEPAFVDELALMMRWAFEHLQADDGGSVYLRLTTRVIEQAAGRPSRRLLAETPGGRLGRRHRLHRRHRARGAQSLRRVAGRPAGPWPAERHLPRPAASRLVGPQRRAVERQSRAALPHRNAAGALGAARWPRHPDRRLALDPVVDRRRAGHARQPARRGPLRPDRRSAGPLQRLPPGRRGDHRRSGGAVPEPIAWVRFGYDRGFHPAHPREGGDPDGRG